MRNLLLLSLALIATPISVVASAQDNMGGATGGMGSSYPVVKPPSGAIPGDGQDTSNNESRPATDGSSIRSGSSSHRIGAAIGAKSIELDKASASGLANAAPASALAGNGSLGLVGGGTPVVNVSGVAIGVVTGRARNSAGLTVGLQVKFKDGTSAIIPAKQLAMSGSILTTTYVASK